MSFAKAICHGKYSNVTLDDNIDAKEKELLGCCCRAVCDTTSQDQSVLQSMKYKEDKNEGLAI